MIFTRLLFNQTSNDIIFYVYIYIFFIPLWNAFIREPDIAECQTSVAAGFVLPVFMSCSVYQNLEMITVVHEFLVNKVFSIFLIMDDKIQTL